MPMKRIALVLILFAACAPAPRTDRRLIEWGWDTPPLQEMVEQLPGAQALAFDGLVLDVATPLDDRGLSWTIYGSRPVDTETLGALAAEYKDFAWGRLTDNFLRLTLYPADVDWFESLGDGWTVIYHNVRQWAQLAHDLGFVGIMLDVEQYGEAHLFDYSRQKYASQMGLDAYARQAYRRGQDLMVALQGGYPGLTVMSTYLVVSNLSQPPERYTLLRPFAECMISAAAETTTLIDGYENAYIYRDEAQFKQAREQILGVRPEYVPASAFPYPIKVGFGLWIDPVCGAGGLPPEGCGFTPQEFKSALTYALDYSDRYVWIYSQNIDWFSGRGIPSVWQDTLAAFRRSE